VAVRHPANIGSGIWHVTLGGAVSGELQAGRADPSIRPSGSVLSLAQRLLATASFEPPTSEAPPGDASAVMQMDFRAALPEPGQATALRFVAPNDMRDPLPASLRELATGLGIADMERRGFELVHILWEVLRRGTVLTDNRRIPFACPG
jgi:hypothetical protein